jgi:hypothetical protein
MLEEKNIVVYNFQNLAKHFWLNGVNNVIWDFTYYQPTSRVLIIQANRGEKVILEYSQPCKGGMDLTFKSQKLHENNWLGVHTWYQRLMFLLLLLVEPSRDSIRFFMWRFFHALIFGKSSTTIRVPYKFK